MRLETQLTVSYLIMLDFLLEILLFIGTPCIVLGASRNILWGLFSFAAVALVVASVKRIGRYRHCALIRKWARDKQMRVISLKHFRPFSLEMGDLWWWRAELYTLNAETPDGQQLTFTACITGTLLNLFVRECKIIPR